MQANTNTLAPAGYAQIKAIPHSLSDLNAIMSRRNKTELATLKAVNDLASTTYSEVKQQQSKWNLIKNLSLSSSFILLSVTTAILFLSPMLTQKQFPMNDPRVYGMGLLMLFVAMAVAIVVDYGRSKILDRSNNGAWSWIIYIIFTLISVGLSTTGMLAIADFYESSNQTDVKGDIDTARKYVMDNGAMASRSVAGIKNEMAAYDKKYYTKGTGYKRRAHDRDIARLTKELESLNRYNSAKATVEGKNTILETTDSSNWLFNTYSKLLNTTASIAAMFIGIFINLVSESMALVAHYRLIRLNARIEITETQWNSAVMASDRATIVNSSSLQLIAGLDVFQHTFAMPTRVLTQYQEKGATMGDFANVNPEPQNIGEIQQVSPLLKNEASPRIDSHASDIKVERMLELYEISKVVKTGDSFLCPTCESTITKTKNRIFCNSTGKGNHKDVYWNTVHPERLKARKG